MKNIESIERKSAGTLELRALRFWVPVGILLLLVIAAYGRLVYGYFAADEWWGFGFALSKQNLIEALKPAGVFAPGANLFIYSLYTLFGANATVWALLVLLLHGINTLLVYWYSYRLSGKLSVGMFTAATFASLPMGSQFLHQFSLMPTSGVATTLAFGALLLYLDRKTLLALVMMTISLLFSPYTAPFILFIGLTELMLLERKSWWRSFFHFAPFVIVMLLYRWLVGRFSSALYDRPITGDGSLFDQMRPIIEKAFQGYGEFSLNLPGLIDPAAMLSLSIKIVSIALIGIIVLFVLKRYRLAKSAAIGLVWIPASLILFSTLNTVASNVTFPSRYFYVTAVGVGLMIGSLMAGLVQTKKLNLDIAALSLVFLLGLGTYLPKTQELVTAEVNTGKAKRKIITVLKEQVPPPATARDALFCFTSNTGHYGTSPEVIPLPFVINFNFVLAEIYRSKEPKLFPLFERSDYFVNPAASWYYYAHPEGKPWEAGPGIGFAASLPECERLAKQYSFINPEQIYGFAYKGDKFPLSNISVPLRQYLAGDSSVRDLLFPW